MAGRIAGITIEIGGNTTKLQTALKGVDNQLKATQNNLKDINRLLKLDPKNTELLTQKQKNLQNAIKQTKDRLSELKNAQSQVKEGTAEWDALQREIIETEQQLKSLEKEYKNFGSVSAQQLKAAGEEVKAFGQKISAIGDKLTTRVTLPLIAFYTATAKYASDFEENMNKLDVAFGDSAQSVKDWSKTASTQYGLSMVASTEAASGFGALAKGIGITDDVAASMSTTLTGLSADLASYFNTSTEDAAAALEGIFTGQSKALTKFGVIMNDTNLRQFAEECNLVWSELDQVQKTMLRYQFVLRATADAQGDYARTSDGTANSIKTFQAAISDLMTVLGQQLLPIITPIIQNLTSIIQTIASLPEPVQRIIVIIGLIVAAIGPLLAIGGRLITGIGMLMIAAPGLAASLSGLLGPIGLVIAGIAALIAIGVALCLNWDSIKEWAAETWQSIQDGFRNFTNKLTSALHTFGTVAKQSIANTWNTAKSVTFNAWNNMVSGVISRANALRTGVSEIFGSVVASVQNMVNTCKSLMNFTWRLPHLPLPHLSVSGSFSLFPPSVPHFSIAWYKKAYDNPLMFTSPTVLQTPQGLKGFGDGHGGEVVLGMNRLRELVDGAGDNIVINVYANEGMNVNQLADAIQNRLVQLSRQKEAAYA